MKSVRMLIVEDEAELQSRLKRIYRQVLVSHGYDSITIETASDVDEARDLAKQAAADPYDLVSLDVNLGDAELSGLDVLATLKRFQSAWMVALLTGAETDETLDATMGEVKGERIRKQLRREAYQKFPAERLLVVEKPSPSLSSGQADELLRNRVEQIALVYGEVGRLRYIFRPIEVVSLERIKTTKELKNKKLPKKFIETTALHWQIRFNCGDIRTLPDKTGFKTLHHLLGLDRSKSLKPEDAIILEPKGDAVVASSSGKVGGDPVADYFIARGIPWNEMTQVAQDQLVQVALSHLFKRYCELREIEDEEDLSPDEEDELVKIRKELGPLEPFAETAYNRLCENDCAESSISLGEAAQEGMHVAGADFEKNEGRKGYDCADAQAFRARMKRVKECLRENGFSAFADHLDGHVSSTGANWSYNPPDVVAWTVF